MLYSGASLGQVRREIKAPQRRFTREALRSSPTPRRRPDQPAVGIANANKQPRPDLFACVRKVADSKVRLKTHVAFHDLVYTVPCQRLRRGPNMG